VADKAAHQVDITGKAGHQLPGLHFVEIGERKSLDMAEELVAHIVSQALSQQCPADALSQSCNCASQCGNQHEHRTSPNGGHIAHYDTSVDDIVERFWYQ